MLFFPFSFASQLEDDKDGDVAQGRCGIISLFFSLGTLLHVGRIFQAAVVVVRRPASASEDRWYTMGRVSNDSDPHSSTL